MEANKEKAYYEEITKYLRSITGFNIVLSSKERDILLRLIDRGFSMTQLKTLIKKEAAKYPPEKRKKIKLLFLEKYLKEKTPEKSSKKQENFQKWNEIINRLNLPRELLYAEEIPEDLRDIAIEKNIINFIWKNMPPTEKEQIKKEALSKLKGKFILTNIDKKKVIKSIIRKIIKEKYGI
jgi:SOS response regulatory protein OraA/RecX